MSSNINERVEDLSRRNSMKWDGSGGQILV